MQQEKGIIKKNYLQLDVAGVDKTSFVDFWLRVNYAEKLPQTHLLTEICEAELRAEIAQTH